MVKAFNKGFYLFIFSVTLLLLAVFGCAGGTTGTGGTQFSGTVVSKTKGALKDILVTLLQTGESTVTDDNGTFLLDSITDEPKIDFSFKSTMDDSIDTTLPVEDLPINAKSVEVNVVIDENTNSVADSMVTVTSTRAQADSSNDGNPPADVCPSDTPVCGLDNSTYANECVAQQAGIAIAYSGDCFDHSLIDSNGNLVCTGPPPASAAVCGKDGVTYPSECFAHQADAEIKHDGECGSKDDCFPDQVCNGLTTCTPNSEVCGKDNRTYASAGQASASGIGVAYHRPCIDQSRISDCSVICTGPPLSSAAVCGQDGESYASECDAIFAGTTVKHSGSCTFAIDCSPDEVCGTITTCPGDGEVCGKDNITYSSAQAAKAAGVGIAYNRSCINSSRLVQECSLTCIGPPLPEDRVCGLDGITYNSECEAIVAGATVLHNGSCNAAQDCVPDEVCGVLTSCPTNGPVCGKDNQTYPSAAAAASAGVGVAYKRECFVYSRLINDCSLSCVGPPTPGFEVCGTDGVTYSTECVALMFGGVQVAHDGEC